MSNHKGHYINFIDVLIKNCNKVLEIFPPKLKNGLCIYTNSSIVYDKTTQETTIEEYI